MKASRKINFLYTNIGRGHPFYLDGIIEAITHRGKINSIRSQLDIFEVSQGIPKFGWQLIRWLYKHGSTDNFVGHIYNKLRLNTDYNQQSRVVKIIGRNIRQKYMPDSNPLVVAHPLLVAILKGKRNLFYQHGEVIAPAEAVVEGAQTIFVPTKETAVPFFKKGYTKEDIIITNLCIEPTLVKQAEDSFSQRIKRIQVNQSLTGAFFSSGAEPKPHIKKILLCAESVISSGGRAIIFARNKKALWKTIVPAFKKKSFQTQIIDSTDYIPRPLPTVLVVSYNSRREENIFTAQLFKYFDYVVAPSHERTNWALGLGLPMFILAPAIGSFAPLNQNVVLNHQVARLIKSNHDAMNFNDLLSSLQKNGELIRMSQSGWHRYDINGFANIAQYLIKKSIGN
ncbi:MAG: hypothetical protein GXO93_00085 [FCB group bacterium]|nr:hypothetical protein [FCB group bacterium]